MNTDSIAFDMVETNCDFVGLFRTEFLYMEGAEFLSEDVQFEAYKRVLANAKGNPVLLRTLDIGGDKVLSYMEFKKEENPFLGTRGLRLCFAKPKILKTQLRAALKASAFGPLWVMFPMVTNMEDIYRAKDYLRQAKEELDMEGILYDKDIKIGVMIELPSIALVADMVAEEVDFASIGTNDLTQYLNATDRMNPAAAVLLTGLGARKLSMSPANIAAVKAALSKVSIEEAKELAKRCKYARTEAEIRRMINMA